METTYMVLCHDKNDICVLQQCVNLSTDYKTLLLQYLNKLLDLQNVDIL